MARGIILLLASLLFWLPRQGAQGGTVLRLRLRDAQEQAVAGAQARLRLYVFESRGGGVTARVWFERSCVTDADGECVIEINERPPDGGMLRGVVEVEGYGRRDVLWPGGELRLTLRLDRLEEGREAGPYEGQEQDGGVAVEERRARWTLAAALGTTLLAMTFFLYGQARREREGRR